MKATTGVLLLLVLSACVLSLAQAARSRPGSQNSFRKAANGVYQTLSNVFGEENIRGLYKVSVWDVPGCNDCSSCVCDAKVANEEIKLIGNGGGRVGCLEENAILKRIKAEIHTHNIPHSKNI